MTGIGSRPAGLSKKTLAIFFALEFAAQLVLDELDRSGALRQ